MGDVDLNGRRVLITGGASGIGRACVRIARAAGAAVAALDVNEDGLASLAAECGAVPVVVDLKESAAIRPAVDAAIAALGGLDGVVNCAGVAPLKPVSDLSETLWRDTMAINLTAPFLICQAALAALREKGGSIVNVASAAALVPAAPWATVYAASKGGLQSFSKALATELAPDIRVNTVCPGFTDTPMTASMIATKSALQTFRSRYLLRRAAEPEEIARVILFLLSDGASYVTGATVAADGGRTFH